MGKQDKQTPNAKYRCPERIAIRLPGKIPSYQVISSLCLEASGFWGGFPSGWKTRSEKCLSAWTRWWTSDMYEKTGVPAIGIAKHEPLETPWNRFSPESMPSKIPRSEKTCHRKLRSVKTPFMMQDPPKPQFQLGWIVILDKPIHSWRRVLKDLCQTRMPRKQMGIALVGGLPLIRARAKWGVILSS